MKPRQLLGRLARGEFANVDFADLQRLVEALGFTLQRVNGSHHIYAHPRLSELVKLQESGAKQSRTRSGSCSGSWSATIWS